MSLPPQPRAAHPLVGRLEALTSSSGIVYRLLRQCLASPAAADAGLPRADATRLAHLVQLLAGQLHSTALAASTCDEGRGRAPLACRLGHLDLCERHLGALRDALAAAVSTRGARVSGHGAVPPAAMAAGHAELDIYHRGLQDVSTRLALAMAADSMTGILRCLSGPSAGHAVPWKGVPIRIPLEKARAEILDAFSTRVWNPRLLLQKVNERTCARLNSWVFEHPSYVEWLQGGLDRLWMHGEPGAGKGVLAAETVQRLRPTLGRDTALCFHFVDRLDESSRGTADIIGALLCQLLAQSTEAYRQLRAHLGLQWDLDDPIPPRGLMAPAKPQVDYSSIPALQRLFRAAASHFRRVYVVLYGLDEASTETGRVLRHVQDMLDGCGGCKLLLFTRTLAGPLCPDSSCSKFKLIKIGPTAGEVHGFVERSVGRANRTGAVGVDLTLVDHIVQRLVASNTNALWMRLQIDHILSLPSDADRYAALDDALPLTLESTYERMLQRVDPGTDSRAWNLTRLCFAWVIHAEEKLTVPQLCEALSVALSPLASTLNEVLPVNEDELPGACRVIQEVDGEDYVQTVHLTVNDFLSSQTARDEQERWMVREGEAKGTLLATCLRFLAFPEFQHAPRGHYTEKEFMLRRRKEHPFYGYAALHWSALAPGNWGVMKGLVPGLFSPFDNYSHLPWLLEYCHRRFPAHFGFDGAAQPFRDLIRRASSPTLSPLHVAACLGLPELCRFLVDTEKQDVNQQDANWGSPLYMALIGPQAFVHGISAALVDTEEQAWGGCPTSPQQQQTVAVLLELGATGSQKCLGDSSVNMASAALLASARLEDAQLFISVHENGAPMDEVFLDTFRRIDVTRPSARAAVTALHAPPSAERQRYVDELCQYIIDTSHERLVEAEVRGDYYDGSPMVELIETAWGAADRVNAPCVDLSRKRWVNCDDASFQAIFEDAIRNFNGVLLSRLLQDPRWVPNRTLGSASEADEATGQAALHCAAEVGDLEAISLLVKSGSDPNLRDAEGRSPLMLAERPEVAEALVEAGADVAAVDAAGRSIWHYAAANNDVGILKSLAKLDPAKTSALKRATVAGRTPLAEAFAFVRELVGLPLPMQSTYYCTAEAALFLLDLCEDDADYFRSDVPLAHLAAEWGIKDLVDGLARFKSVDFGEPAGDGSTAFHCLNFSATPSFIRLLKAQCGQSACSRCLTTARGDGKIPAEAFFHNVRTDSGTTRTRLWDKNAHPSFWNTQPVPGAFEELLTAEVVRSRDSRGVTLWERFLETVYHYYGQRPEAWGAMSGAIAHAMEGLVRHGVLAEFEETAKMSGYLDLLRSIDGFLGRDIRAAPLPPWFEQVSEVVLRATLYFEDIEKQDLAFHAFVRALSLGRSSLQRTILERGFSVHQQVERMSALHHACSYGRCAIPDFKTVLEFADSSHLDDANGYGYGPLQLCVHPDHTSTPPTRLLKLETLLEAGAKPNSVASETTPALVLALLNALPDCADRLIQYGADITARGFKGMDAMLAASLRGCAGVLQRIERAAPPDYDWKRVVPFRPPRGGKSVHCNAIHLAALHSHVDAMAFLLGRGLLSGEERSLDDGWPPLHFAAQAGSSASVQFLAAKGADLQAQDLAGQTPLHIAAREDHFYCVKALIELGCDVSATDNHGLTPAMAALAANAPKCASLLLRTGAGLSSTETPGASHGAAGLTSRGQSLLRGALEAGLRLKDRRLLEAVLAEGCPVDAVLPGCSGCNALIWSVRTGDAELTDFFLQRGARTLAGHCLAHAPGGYSAVHEACRSEKSSACLHSVLDAALRLGYDWFNVDPPLITSIVDAGDTLVLSKVFDHIRANLDDYRGWLPPSLPSSDLPLRPEMPHPITHFINLGSPSLSHTALHRSMDGRNAALAELLLQNGASVDARGPDLGTPLHTAARRDCPGGAQVLLRHGCAVDPRDRYGMTPLMLAGPEVLELLLRYGADAHAVDLQGMTVLHHCVGRGNPALFRLLAEREGLDPSQRDSQGRTALQAAMAVMDPSLTTLVVSGDYDIETAMSNPQLMLDMVKRAIERPTHATRVLPRLIRALFARSGGRPASWAETCAPALCHASAHEDCPELEVLLRSGADVNMAARSPEDGPRPPLMVASRRGSLPSVRALVRAGAQVSYRDREGRVHNALEAARYFPDIVRWLLVAQRTEAKLLATVHGARRAVSPWSGPAEMRYRLAGAGGWHGRTHGESTLDYALRMSRLKERVRGRVVLPYEDS